jgi:hypothetical protein
MHRPKMGAAVLILIILLFSAGMQAQARIMVVPSADVLPDGNVELRLYNHLGRTYLGGAVGMFGAMQAEVTGIISSTTQLRTAIQLALVKEQQAVPGVALGMEIQASHVGFYGVLSKQLGLAGLRGHVAWGSGRFSNGMVGVSYVLNPVQVNSNTPVVTLGVEYDGQGLNGGLIAQFAQNVSAHVYLSDFQRLGAGLRYRLAF